MYWYAVVLQLKLTSNAKFPRFFSIRKYPVKSLGCSGSKLASCWSMYLYKMSAKVSGLPLKRFLNLLVTAVALKRGVIWNIQGCREMFMPCFRYDTFLRRNSVGSPLDAVKYSICISSVGCRNPMKVGNFWNTAGISKQSPMAKSGPRSHFIQPQRHFPNNEKNKRTICSFGGNRSNHINVKFTVLELLCNSWCVPRDKNVWRPFKYGILQQCCKINTE